MCCLRYENDEYTRLRKDLPKLNSMITFEDSKYRITSMNVLQNRLNWKTKKKFDLYLLKNCGQIRISAMKITKSFDEKNQLYILYQLLLEI